jgi:flavin reductase (DIM6/NTAB) family NADH-FMN oxidoreductase RutF
MRDIEVVRGGAMKKKQSVPIKTFWYSDQIVWPKTVTIVTTVNEEGVPNAAPLSGIMHYDNLDNQPRVMLMMRKFAHTIQNICKTGEFVVNFPPYEYTDDILEACRFYPKGVNELDFMRMTPIPSQKVTPPTLAESRQVLECKLDKFYDLDESQRHAIGNIVNILVDEDLVGISRPELAKAVDPIITLGDAGRRFFHWTRIGDIQVDEVQPPPKEDEIHYAVQMNLEWEAEALKMLEEVPMFVRSMIVEMAEQIVENEGDNIVTKKRFKKMQDDYTPPSMMDRFDTSD